MSKLSVQTFKEQSLQETYEIYSVELQMSALIHNMDQ